MKKRTNISHSQNFLTSSIILKQLTNAVMLPSNLTIFEIGSGKGHWTYYLSKKFERIYGIELDTKLYKQLNSKFDTHSNVEFIHSDILAYQFPKHASPPYVIIGNIPFHISTKIIKHIVFQSMASDSYLIVEKGFAKRLTSSKISVQQAVFLTQMDIALIMPISSKWFHPRPQIDAALIHLSRKRRSDVALSQIKLFEQFTRDVLSGKARKHFTKNQLHRAMQHAKINNDQVTLDYEQILSLFQSYQLFH